MILKNKKILITGILTDKSIAFATAKIALENGATVVATGFGKGLRITERAVKRLSDDIKVFEMDIENLNQVNEAVKNIEDEVGNLDGILHAIAFSPTEAMGGNFLNTTVEDAVKSFEISAFSLKTLATSFQPILNKPSSISQHGGRHRCCIDGCRPFVAVFWWIRSCKWRCCNSQKISSKLGLSSCQIQEEGEESYGN